jgi:hypothetical protein
LDLPKKLDSTFVVGTAHAIWHTAGCANGNAVGTVHAIWHTAGCADGTGTVPDFFSEQIAVKSQENMQ